MDPGVTSLMRCCRFLPALFVVAVFGCSNSPTQNSESKSTPATESTKTTAVQREQEFQNRWIAGSEAEEYQIREQVRATVTDFVKNNLPGWTVKGMSSEVHALKIFSIDADLEKQGHHVVITFDVRRFFPESGEPYWLAVPLNKFREDRLQKLDDAYLMKRLDNAQRELDELRR
jgi:hypothetical protein